jgi:GntR family transcriptional regulator
VLTRNATHERSKVKAFRAVTLRSNGPQYSSRFWTRKSSLRAHFTEETVYNVGAMARPESFPGVHEDASMTARVSRAAAARTTRATRRFPRLRKSSPVPLYYQLKRAIEQFIDEGEWPPETQVPSERRLCEQFHISRITVRQALADLERQGRLVRSHGRGTYVAEVAIKKPVFPLVSFTHDVREHGLEPGARVLQFEVAPPAPHVTAALELKPGEPMLLLKRLRLANQKPLAVETVHLAGACCPDLLDEDLTNRSLYETLAARYGIVPDRAQQQWQAVPCPTNEAHYLEVASGSPVLRIEQTTFDSEGHPFEHLESYFRGDKFILVAELGNGGRAQRNGDSA